MPYELSSSPVAPRTGSRLWTVGAGTAIAIAALLGAAALHPENAAWLVGAAVFVGLTTWGLNRTPPRVAGPEPTRETPGLDADASRLESAFEAFAEPVLVVSGGEPDDIAGRRIVLANAAALQNRTMTTPQRFDQCFKSHCSHDTSPAACAPWRSLLPVMRWLIPNNR